MLRVSVGAGATTARRPDRALGPAPRDGGGALATGPRPGVFLPRGQLCPTRGRCGRSPSVLLAAALGLLLAAPPPLPGADDARLEALLASVKSRSLDGRLLGLGEQLVGTPCAHSPLGEGEGQDPDPRLRLDHGLPTFVGGSDGARPLQLREDFVHVLDSIRYRSRPDYAGRNHLMEAEWLPSNAAKGLVRDVTAQLGGEGAIQDAKVIGPEAWASTTARALALPAEARLTGRFPLSVLPVREVSAHAARWPSGTLLLVVRQDAPWRITRVSHLGFVVQRGGKTYLRHATRGWKDGVVDEEISHLLARHAGYTWKVQGVSLWGSATPVPRRTPCRSSHTPRPSLRPVLGLEPSDSRSSSSAARSASGRLLHQPLPLHLHQLPGARHVVLEDAQLEPGQHPARAQRLHA